MPEKTPIDSPEPDEEEDGFDPIAAWKARMQEQPAEKKIQPEQPTSKKPIVSSETANKEDDILEITVSSKQENKPLKSAMKKPDSDGTVAKEKRHVTFADENIKFEPEFELTRSKSGTELIVEPKAVGQKVLMSGEDETSKLINDKYKLINKINTEIKKIDDNKPGSLPTSQKPMLQALVIYLEVKGKREKDARQTLNVIIENQKKPNQKKSFSGFFQKKNLAERYLTLACQLKGDVINPKTGIVGAPAKEGDALTKSADQEKPRLGHRH